MVRNLMMIVGLSLAVAAFGCSDDEGTGGTGGTAGSGGSAGAGGSGGAGGEGGSGGATPVDACLGAADLAMVCSPTFGDDFVSPCATAALGQGPATSTCLQEDPPALSPDCADCFGNVTQCVFDNCVGGSLDGPCAPPNAPDSAGCLTCRDESGCDAAQDLCTGDLATACQS